MKTYLVYIVLLVLLQIYSVKCRILPVNGETKAKEELWRYGVMALWRYGVMELWSYGVMALWSYGDFQHNSITN